MIVSLFMKLAIAGFVFAAALNAAGFEVADLHASPIVRNPYLRGPYRTAQRYEIRQATLVDLINGAYGVERERILEGPNWVEMDRFDIIAKRPAGASKNELKTFLQGTLEERFHLKVHKDTRKLSGFTLTADKTTKLKKSDGTGRTGCDESISMEQQEGGGRGAPMALEKCRNVTMEKFAETIRWEATAPIVDQTGLEGAWDFDVKLPCGESFSWVPTGRHRRGWAMPWRSSLDSSLPRQLCRWKCW